MALGLDAAKRLPIASTAEASTPLPAFLEVDLDPLALAALFEDREAVADLDAEGFAVVLFADARAAVEPPDDFEAAELFDLVEPPEFDFPADCFAPPEAVRFPAAPLFVPVDVLDPPRADAVEAFEVPPLDVAFLAVVAIFDAPVLELLELFAPELLFDPPVFPVEDLLFPLAFEAVLEAAVFLFATDDAAVFGFLPDPLPVPEDLVVVAVAMSIYSRLVSFEI
jgi:hypothetical protein